jgi:TonB family protein
VARTPLHQLISVDDYPAAALAAGEQGLVHVVLDIGPDGRVTGCTIVASSRSAQLDSATCRILRSRARFTPARDSLGKAAADRHHQRISWRLPTAPQIPPAVQAAMQAWAQCIGPRLEAGARNPARTPRELADGAMLPCRAQEDQMLTAMAAAKNMPAPGEKERAGLREHVVARIAEARARKQP